ncbi:MAG: hypothetical protein N3F05_01925 [Candidatus Diapherotrites archaeon]|nr:hypothetical protein [Candidatus Diapherotrites archaeon]
MAKKVVKKATKKDAEKIVEKKIEQQPKEKASQTKEAVQEVAEKLPFPNSVVVRIMRQNLDPGKQIKKRVKVEMNKWLADMAAKISQEMNKQPYRTIDYAMFKDAVAKYTKLEEIADERERLLGYVNKIKSDCEYMEKEIRRKFALSEEEMESLIKQE